MGTRCCELSGPPLEMDRLQVWRCMTVVHNIAMHNEAMQWYSFTTTKDKDMFPIAGQYTFICQHHQPNLYSETGQPVARNGGSWMTSVAIAMCTCTGVVQFLQPTWTPAEIYEFWCIGTKYLGKGCRTADWVPWEKLAVEVKVQQSAYPLMNI